MSVARRACVSPIWFMHGSIIEQRFVVWVTTAEILCALVIDFSAAFEKWFKCVFEEH